MKNKYILGAVLALVMAFSACTTNWVSEVEAIVNVSLPIVSALATTFGAKTATVSKITTDLGAVETAINSYKTTKASSAVADIQAALTDANANLATIATDFGASSANSTKATAVVNLVSQEFSAIVAALPQTSTTGKVAAAAPGPKPKSAKQLKKEYNAILAK